MHAVNCGLLSGPVLCRGDGRVRFLLFALLEKRLRASTGSAVRLLGHVR
jgi:hypothetical protein